MTRNDSLRGQASLDPAQADDLDCSLTIAAMLERYPATLDVFNRFGLDSCCGGGLSIEAAAKAHKIDSAVLCSALRDAAFA